MVVVKMPARTSRELYFFWITSAAILIGFILTILSWLGTCTESCAEGHKYRLFGMSFEIVGFLYFVVLSLTHGFSWKYPKLLPFTGFLLASGIGAEAYFIRVQKVMIGTWCPICLSIAASLIVASIPFIIDYFLVLKSAIQKRKREDIMRNIFKGLGSLSVGVLGFCIAFLGVVKNDKVMAAENVLKHQVIFGSKTSPVEVYIFTSWACPACRKAEPNIEQMLPVISKNSSVTFVDQAGDLKTLNYIPYNLSFMLKNKPQYLELRKILGQIALDTDEPTEEQVEEAVKKIGINYQQLHYSDVSLGIRYFKELLQRYDIRSIPAIIVINKNTKKEQRLVGTAEISIEKVQAAIEAVK